MSLTKITMPEDVALSHNIIPVEVSTDKYLLGLGTKQVLKIFFSLNTSNGKILTFGWNEFTMVLTFKTTPNDEGYELPLYNDTSAGGYDALQAAFELNYYINKYYVVTKTVALNGSSGKYECDMRFTQRKFGLTFKADTFTGNDASNYVPSILTAYVAPSHKANFRALLDIYWQVDGTDPQYFNEFITQLDASSLDTGVIDFNLNDVFKKWSRLFPDFALMGETGVTQCGNVLQNYWIKITENYGSPEVSNYNVLHPAAPAANNYLQVILGGMPFLSVPGNSFYDDYCNATFNKFLTTQVSGKTTVCKAMEHSLSFYIKDLYTDVGVTGTLYLDDGTTVAIPKVGAASPDRKTVNRAAVGYDALELEDLLTGSLQPVKYEVWIESSGSTRLTEKFTFMVDLRYNEYNSYLYFHNSLGGIDCAWLTGMCAPLPEYSGQEVEKAITNDYTEGNMEISNSRTRLGWDMNTGYKQIKGEIDHLVELAQSNNVRWMPDTKIKAGVEEPIKVIINKGSLKDWPADQDDLFCLSFKMQEAHYEF